MSRDYCMGRGLVVLALCVALATLCRAQAGADMGVNEFCNGFVTCDACVAASVDCFWCPTLGSAMFHCNSKQSSVSTDCPQLQNPGSNVTVTIDDGVRAQVVPQAATVRLRVGEPQTFPLDVTPLADSPLDVYFLIDNSASLENALNSLQNSVNEIALELANISSNFQVGFGVFVDKATLPYALSSYRTADDARCSNRRPNCDPTFSYRHTLSMTTNLTLLETAIDDTSLSANVDAPEGGFDALIQIAACTDVIGWRDDALRLVFHFTDNEYHIAGDGRLAGIVRRNDGKCHLQRVDTGMAEGSYEYDLGTVQDYPSVYQLQNVLRENLVVPIFVSTSSRAERTQTFVSLAQEIKSTGAVARFWNRQAGSLVEVIRNSYDSITQSVTVNTPAVEGLSFQVETVSGCSTSGGSSDCETSFNNTVTFNVTVTLESCATLSAPINVSVVVQGFGRLLLNVEPLCTCACSMSPEPLSPNCSRNGSLVCGVCDCNAGRFGDTCQCDQQVTACPIRGGMQCSGMGSCDACGQCQCIAGTFGDACECSRSDCPMGPLTMSEGAAQNLSICSGQGMCVCRGGEEVCVCDREEETGFPFFDVAAVIRPPATAGRAGNCECSPSDCYNENFPNVLCANTAGGGSPNGDCRCMGCFCPDNFQIENNTCTPMTSLCEPNVRCAMCHREEVTACSGCLSETLLDDLEPLAIYSVECTYVDDNGCTVTFFVAQDNPSLPVLVRQSVSCPLGGLPWIIAGSIVGAILLLGLLILLLVKLILLALERVEYKRFTRELQDADFAPHDNPLYLTPHQDYENPVHKRRTSSRRQQQQQQQQQ